nr:sensor domain-containing diguanylate cyclase [Cellulomonas sp. APG4]
MTEWVVRFRADDLTVLYCNRAWAGQHGRAAAELVGQSLSDLLLPEEMVWARRQVERLGPATPQLYDPTARPSLRVPDVWLEWTDRYLEGPDGRGQVLSVGRDVSERHTTERLLAQSEARFRALADHSADLVWHVQRAPRAELTYLSPSVETLTGWPAERFLGHLGPLLALTDEDGRALLREALDGGEVPDRFDLRVRRPDGDWVVLEMRLAQLEDGLQGVGRDVTEMRALQAEMAELALHDPLTGLANRRMLEVLLGAALARVRRSGEPLVVAYLDLDHFKPVNDTHGHAFGDLVLVEVAERLRASLRDADVVARLGGDEFVVALETPADDASTVASRIEDALGEPMLVEGVRVTCGASVGWVLADGDEDVAAVVARADAAMYRVKRRRRAQRGS